MLLFSNDLLHVSVLPALSQLMRFCSELSLGSSLVPFLNNPPFLMCQGALWNSPASVQIILWLIMSAGTVSDVLFRFPVWTQTESPASLPHPTPPPPPTKASLWKSVHNPGALKVSIRLSLGFSISYILTLVLAVEQCFRISIQPLCISWVCRWGSQSSSDDGCAGRKNYISWSEIQTEINCTLISITPEM